MKKTKYILVPWDFTDKAEFALLHAIKIAKHSAKEVLLLHIIRSSGKNNTSILNARLGVICKKARREHNVMVEHTIVEGDIFSSISDYASDNPVSMVVMGTHGMRGMQKLTGSWALKVITGSPVPFLVVQDKPDMQKEYDNIVFPLDFKTESKEKITWAIYMAKYFNSKVHILKIPFSDSGLTKKVNTNINFTLKYFIQNGVDYQISELDNKSSNHAKDILDFAEKVNSDLVLTVTTKNISLFDYAFGAIEQKLIANDRNIPIMCINPINTKAQMSQFMTGSA